MNKKITTLLAFASVLTVSLVSCGPNEPEDNTVPELPVLSTEAEATEAASEAETEEKTEAPTEKDTEAEVTTEEATEEPTEAEEATEAPEVTEPDEPEEPQEEQPEEPEPAPQPQGVKFSFGTLHSDASGIVSSLGDALNVTTAPACFSNGADSKIYEYDGLKIECYVLGGVEKIYCVTITNSNYSTDTGITIGSSQADVEASYGVGEAGGAYTIYYSGNSELDVRYDGGTVSEIIFYTAV